MKGDHRMVPHRRSLAVLVYAGVTSLMQAEGIPAVEENVSAFTTPEPPISRPASCAQVRKLTHAELSRLDVDTLIACFHGVDTEKNKEVLEMIRQKIDTSAREQQKAAIIAVRKQKKRIKAEKARSSRRPRRSGRKERLHDRPKRKKRIAASQKASRTHEAKDTLRRQPVVIPCEGLECTWRRLKRTVSDFFRKATQKRTHPAPKKKPDEVLKGRI